MSIGLSDLTTRQNSPSFLSRTNQDNPQTTSEIATHPLLHVLPDMSHIQDGRLFIAGCDVEELARTYGTPLIAYDRQHLIRRCKETAMAFAAGSVYVFKAFACIAMARIVKASGLGLDVAAGGAELHTAMAAGFPPERLIMHGPNKSLEDLSNAVGYGVGRICIESIQDIENLASLLNKTEVIQSVIVRCHPDLPYIPTHDKLAAGVCNSPFGCSISNGDAERAIKKVINTPCLDLVGLHFSVGSQISDLSIFDEALRALAPLVRKFNIEHLTIGGGLAAPYAQEDPTLTISGWASYIHQIANQLGIKASVAAEPGRSIAANAAVTLYEIGVIKQNGNRENVLVDGGMSDNPRPALYDATYEHFLPRAMNSLRTREAIINGYHCEPGDVLVKAAALPQDIAVGDIVALPATGAYTYSMASNYHRVRKPAVVFLEDGQAELVIRRQTYDDVLACDIT